MSRRSRFWKGTNTRRWIATRQQVLIRDNWTCQKCGQTAIRPEVDHIVPLEQGGDKWDMANLQTLCRTPCHEEKTLSEREGRFDQSEWGRYVQSLVSE